MNKEAYENTIRKNHTASTLRAITDIVKESAHTVTFIEAYVLLADRVLGPNRLEYTTDYAEIYNNICEIEVALEEAFEITEPLYLMSKHAVEMALENGTPLPALKTFILGGKCYAQSRPHCERADEICGWRNECREVAEVVRDLERLVSTGALGNKTYERLIKETIAIIGNLESRLEVAEEAAIA